MLKELAESKEKFLKPVGAIKRRRKRTVKAKEKTKGNRKAAKLESPKNATELFEDKTIAFLYVLACKWLYATSLDESTLIGVKEILAVAMDSISKIGEDYESYAFIEVLGLLDKDEEDPKTPNNQPRSH
jgi:hypothetical protein